MSDPLDSLTTALASRYTVERELGRGGMATVYLAEPDCCAAIGNDAASSKTAAVATTLPMHRTPRVATQLGIEAEYRCMLRVTRLGESPGAGQLHGVM